MRCEAGAHLGFAYDSYQNETLYGYNFEAF